MLSDSDLSLAEEDLAAEPDEDERLEDAPDELRLEGDEESLEEELREAEPLDERLGVELLPVRVLLAGADDEPVAGVAAGRAPGCC